MAGVYFSYEYWKCFKTTPNGYFRSSRIDLHRQCSFYAFATSRDLEPIPVNSQSWQSYKNDAYGFEIQYPSTWVVKEDLNGFAPSISFTNTLEPERVNILTPAYGKAWQDKAVLIISFLPNNGLDSLEQWYDKMSLSTPIPNKKLDSPIQIGGGKTITEQVSDTDGYHFYYVENDPRIIQIGYRTHQTNFSTLYENMLVSFKFLK